MNVAAFSEVFQTSLVIEVSPDLSISVRSLAGIAILKLFAWLNRHDERDVQDLLRILETYTDAGNLDRLYEEENTELERVGFDAVLAGAFLLGKDAQRITDREVSDQLSTALSGNEIHALVQQVARTISVFEDRTESARALLDGFFRGIGLQTLR